MFPGVTILGCYLHCAQVVWRKVQEFGQGSQLFSLMKLSDFSLLSISAIFREFFPMSQKHKLYPFTTSNEVLIPS